LARDTTGNREGFELPDGAELLAEGSDFPVEAFRLDHCFGFQFHPDVTYAMMHRWTTRGHARLECRARVHATTASPIVRCMTSPSVRG
jgi:GMP synthase-like glutamine amidotransferase